MPPKPGGHTPTPSTSSLAPLQDTSRRTSLASHATQSPKLPPKRLQALDQIHNSASRSETYTTFEEFSTPPRPKSSADRRSFADDLVSGGLSGLYSRFKASVGAGNQLELSPSSSSAKQDVGDNLSVRSYGSRPVTSDLSVGQASGSPLPSPVVTTASSSRVNTPVMLPTTSSQTAPLTRIETVKSTAPTLKELPPQKSGRASDDSRAVSRSSLASEDHDREVDVEQLNKVLSNHSQLRVDTTNTQLFAPSSGQLRVTSDADPKRDPTLAPFAPPNLSDDAQFISESDVTPMADEGLWRNNSNTGKLVFTSNHEPRTTKPKLPLDTGDASKRPTNRPPLIKVSQSHLPGFQPSRTTSSDGFATPVLSTPGVTIQHQVYYAPPALERRHHQGAARMRNKILAKELWMRDENAKDCFSCGDAFSAFRRKHHCRTCGNIFDAKCTVLVPGAIFDQAGRIRICKPCEAMIYGTDDDSSNYSDDGDTHSIATRSFSPQDQAAIQEVLSDGGREISNRFSESLTVGTPTMGIPMSRKQGNETKRRSAVIEIDGQHHQLARPSSSRSLKSLSGRPRSASHKRHGSKHGHLHIKNLRSTENLAPFARSNGESSTISQRLPAFHRDNIIDPDLAPYLSDEGSSDDDTPNIFAALQSDSQSPGKTVIERSAFGGFLAAMRKGKNLSIDRGTSLISGASRDADTASLIGRKPSRHSRKRTLSVSTIPGQVMTPRRSKSSGLLRTVPDGTESSPITYSPMVAYGPQLPLPNHALAIRSSAMRGEAAPAVELNRASMDHVKKLMRQLLQDSGFRHLKRWEKALLPILLRCTDDVNPDKRNDDIDIRHYIKLKKVPGGKPGDTSYISGIVFTKNLALKSMPRSIVHPRIVLVTFAIEYARHQQHFMSLEPVIAQEREYLRNLVKRILALKPHVLLVEKHVRGLALEMLAEANVAVVQNVKASVLSAVSRCTQTRLITSVDKLSLDPSHVGRCGNFDVKTYMHGNMRKTYIYITGCQPQLGCTIVLRGANKDELRRLKRVTEFMSYVVYNLKLETCVMRDEYVQIPSGEDHVSDAEDGNSPGVSSPQIDEPQTEEQRKQSPTASEETPAVNIQAPDAEQKALASAKKHDGPTFAEDIVDRLNTQIISSSPFVKFMQPWLLTQVRKQEARMFELKQIRDHYRPPKDVDTSTKEEHGFQLIEPDMIHNLVEHPSRFVREFLFSVHSAQYEETYRNYQTLRRQWEASCGSSRLFDPFNHQRIAVLYTMVNTRTSNPCIGPDVIALGFYAEHDLEEGFLPDIALGQYVEDLCKGAMTPCSAAGCGEAMYHHHRQYVHAGAQMSVVMSKYPSRIRGMQNTILMWSSCRICASETQVIPMSDNTWKYSFGKYLELTFWSTGLHPRAHACPHDIHRDHVRYFGFNNVAIRVQYDPVMNHEIIVPKAVITWKVDSDLRLKNDQFVKFKGRLDKFMISVKARIESIHVDSVVPEKLEACRQELDRLRKKANDDHKWLTKKLQDKYSQSRYYELIPMNRAGRAIHENSLTWDEIFNEFEKNFFPSERDIRRLAAIQLKKMFLDRDESITSMTAVEEDEESAVELKEFKDEVIAASPVLRRLSTMSPADTHQVLDSIVKQEHENEKAIPQDDQSQAPDQSPDQIELPPSPAASPHHMANREDVKHLDLAIPIRNLAQLTSRPSLSQTDPIDLIGQHSEQDIMSQLQQLAPSESNDSGTVTPLAISNGQTAPVPIPDAKPMESRIPRLIQASQQEQRLTAPPLLRSQSQPQHQTSPSLGPSKASDVSSAMSFANSALGKTDRLKNLIADPARALERRMVDRLTSTPFRTSRGTLQSFIPRSIPNRSSRVSTLARHFEQISREFEKQRVRERQLRAERGRRAYPLASSKPVVEVYRNEQEAVQAQDNGDLDFQFPMSPSERTSMDIDESARMDQTVEGDAMSPRPPMQRAMTVASPQSNPIRSEEETRPSIDAISVSETDQTDQTDQSDSETDHTFTEDVDAPESITDAGPMSPSESQIDLSVELPKHEKTSIMKLLTSFWSERSASGWSPLEYPFGAHEHVWQDSDIIIREDEPASIIALALSSADYQTKMRQFRGQDPDLPSPEDDQTSIERNLLHPKNTNIRYAFQNRGVRAHCKIFFAESFDALRRKTGVADRIVDSLSRCLKWDSKGGKTKSLFLKTLDDRFVLKSLSPVEVTAFFNLAPDYFFFIHQNLFTQLPSVIAKMFGLFQVTIRNPTSGVEFNWYMIVMENLFYDRHTNRRFDLKGSMRNRKIQSTGEKDEVLLDENLVDLIFEKPIFVREHTMKTLKNSVYNDTLFLSKQNVMDYSLMAGFDDNHLEILVGIIDCIRTYTWDKKLETWIKDRGKNKPTVTSPKDYRNRFRIAMSKYVLHAPDCWHQFGVGSTQVVLGSQVKSERVGVESVVRGESLS